MINYNKSVFYVNVYPHGLGALFYDRPEQAEWAAKGCAIYRIKITIK